MTKTVEAEAVLRNALRTVPSETDEEDTDLAVEKMGDPAFAWIALEIRNGSLSPAEAVRGLRLLARLTRQFCVGRKGELLDLVLAISREPSASVEVRSAAAHIAVMSARTARSLLRAPELYGRSVEDIEVQACQAVSRALELGLTVEVGAFVKEFLVKRAQ
jgi:hypothetical protein